MTLDQHRGVTYVPVVRPVGFWTVLTVLLLESVHAYARGPNAQPVVAKLMLPEQSSTLVPMIARVHDISMPPSVAEQPLPPVTVTLYLMLHAFSHGVEEYERNQY